MTQYCIQIGNRQQCKSCILVNGKLINNDGYVFPNCPNTQWIQIGSWTGTNNTPVYEVIPMPLDDYIPLLGVAMVLVTFRKRLKIKLL